MSNQPDVVLMDVNLEGGREGIEVARWLNKVCEAPIVFVTSYSDRDTVERISQQVPGAQVLPKAAIATGLPQLSRQFAERRKASTRGVGSMAAPDRFIAWCKQEQASIEQQLELLRAGKVRTGEDIGAGWIDTTTESIERAQARLSELDELLTAAGSATVIKPDASPA